MIINKPERRKTLQKIKIMDFLHSTREHPTAEVVYKKVKKDIPTITLATVYRNLNKLSEDGEILKLEINGEYHFDADMSAHQHCICNECGCVLDVHNNKLSANAIKAIEGEGFEVEQISITYRGICKNCKR